jgi:hypothetical protein
MRDHLALRLIQCEQTTLVQSFDGHRHEFDYIVAVVASVCRHTGGGLNRQVRDSNDGIKPRRNVVAY